VLTSAYRIGKEPANKGRTFPAEVLHTHEIAALLDVLPTQRGPNRVTAKRCEALIVVLWRGGTRLGETLALARHDIDVARGMISLRETKYARPRVIGLDPDAMAVLSGWLDLHQEIGCPQDGPVFCTVKADSFGWRVKPSKAREQIQYYARKAGITRRVHPHGLRHTWTVENALEGKNSYVIMRHLGHKNLATTQHYLEKLGVADVVQMAQDRRLPDEVRHALHLELHTGIPAGVLDDRARGRLDIADAIRRRLGLAATIDVAQLRVLLDELAADPSLGIAA
jgi:integrase